MIILPEKTLMRNLKKFFKSEPLPDKNAYPSIDDENRQFLLCLGTQKAGTSWLFDFLKNVENVRMGFTKELHVFDRQEFGDFLEQDFKIVESVEASESLLQHRHLWKRLSLVSNPEDYYDYFEHLLKPKGKTLTGDFTPEYCLLSPVKLMEIKNNFNLRGINVKVIFLMRDPVERIWSAQRMNERVTGNKFTLLESYQAKYIEMLTRYEDIIPKIRSVFDDADIYINFYENLFTEQSINEITDFLSLPRTTPDYNKRVNASRYQEIPKGDRQVVAEYYSETYDFVRREFGHIYPQETWS